MRLYVYIYCSVILCLSLFFFKYNLFFFYKNIFIKNILFFFKIFWISGIFLAFFLFFISNTDISLIFGFIIFLILPLLVILFIFLKNIFFFIYIYEFFLFPSIILVFFFSPNRRFLYANIYFIMWTQVGSILILVVILLIFFKNNLLMLVNLNLQINFYYSIIILIGFSIKIPLWPFYFWLTKTHVEAPTFFSIYLSGFLVKTAILGILVLLRVISSNAKIFLLIICIISIIDSTFKMLVQVDLKKIIAYATVQEMGLILILMLISNKYMLFYTGLFIITHTILSSLFFFIVDCVYKRYKTRTVNNVYGIFNENYLFGIFIIISLFLYLGFPFTMKFFIELKLFLFLFSYNHILLILLIFTLNLFGSFFFAKIWFNVLFGLNFFKKIIFLKKIDHMYFWFFISMLVVLPYISISL